MTARFGWAAWMALRRDAARYRWIRYNGGCPLSCWDIADTDAERDAAVDAARYRWLRSASDVLTEIMDELPNGDGFQLKRDDDMDAAIDAAIRAVAK